MHNMHKWIALLLLLWPTAQLASAQSESLLVGPGDMIQVDVMDTPEMAQQVRVTDDGSVTLAYLGSVQVAGKTPAAAAAAIEALFVQKAVMRHPQVTVRVEEYATQDVSILGEVKTPGSYAIATPQSILKVISLAGGLTGAADRQITIKRRRAAEAATYYLSNDPKQALADLVTVYPGDTILVPRAPLVYIMGDVNRPGGYAITTNDSQLTVLEAIAMAGSANKTSVQSHIRLIRKGAQGSQEITVHLDAIQKGKQPDVLLQENDILYVPFSWAKNVAMSSGQIAASTAGAAMYVIP